MKRTPLIASLILTSAVIAQDKPATQNAAKADSAADLSGAVSTARPKILTDTIKPSLVVVQFTYNGEMGKRDFSAEGIVIRQDGLVIVPSDFTPRGVPDEQMGDFKIILPGDEETEIEAKFLGRDDRYGISFVQASPKAEDKSRKWTPLKFVDAKLQPGDNLQSVGMLPKSAGYTMYDVLSRVSANLRGPTPQVLVDGSLGGVGSPVLNNAGEAVGYVHNQGGDEVVHPVIGREGGAIGFVNIIPEQPLLLDDSRGAMLAITNPPHLFVPASDFLPALENPPSPGKPIKFPFVGISNSTGLTKDVAEVYGLKPYTAIQIGDVIPGFSADKAGIKKGDIIATLNGKPLERGDVPDETPQIFTRTVSRMKVGDTITLGVVSEPGQKPHEVKLTLDERPALANTAKRYYAEDLGFSVRSLVFEDTYSRKLPQDTKGVIVAFIRPQGNAQSAGLGNGDLVQQINQTAVTDVEQFKKTYQQLRKDKPKDAVVLEVVRGGNTQIIRIEPPRE